MNIVIGVFAIVIAMSCSQGSKLATQKRDGETIPINYKGEKDLSETEVYLENYRMGKMIYKDENGYYIKINEYMKNHQYSEQSILFIKDMKVIISQEDIHHNSTTNSIVDTIWVAEFSSEQEYYNDPINYETIPRDSVGHYFWKSLEQR